PPPPPRPVYATLAEHPALAHLLLPSDEPSIRQLITEGTLVIARSPSVGEGDEAISQGQIASASPRDDPDPTAPQLLYDYAYEFDADSSEITVIKELATGLTKRYREGLLISQTDPDGAVTAYEYTTDPAGYSDPLNEALATAAGAAQTLASGAVIHYARASSVQPWQVVGLTTPDGRYLTKPDSLSPYPLADPSFESWSQGGQQAPDGWRWSGGSGNSVSQETDPSHVRQETSSVQLGTPPLKLANGSDGSDYSFIYQDILPPYSPEVRALAGRTFTLEVWVKSDRPGAARIGLSSNEYDFSAFHPGDNEWHLLTITHTITTGSINFNAWIKVNGFEASAYFDNAQLIEGPAELLLLSDPAQLRSLELPADRASLRRLVEQGTLSLRGGEVESVIASAEGAKQSQDEIALASLHSDHSPVLSRAVVTYQGKPRETFTYSYSDVIASPTEGGAKQSLTRITDSSGAIRTYSDNNLIAIEEPSGTRWEVSYAKDLAQDQLETLRSLKPETIHYTDLQGREQSLQIQVPDLSAFNEQRGAQVTIHRLARLALPEGQLLTEGFPDDAVIEREFGAEGQLLTQTFASGMVTLYEESRPILTLDSSGRITTTFDYDAAGRLTKTTLIGARQEIFDQITNAEAEVIQRRTQALEELARQKGVAYQDLANRASAARAQLTDQQASLQHKLNDVEAMKAKGKAGKSAKSQAMDQIRAGMNQVRDALSNLDNQYAEALGQLNAQVESVRQEVESQTIQAFTEIHVKQVELAKAILRQELTTILIRAYRDTIGRDPSEQEVTQEVERLYSRYGSDPSAKVDLADLTQRIRVLPDYAPRASDVSEIKRRVASWLQDYVVIATGDTSVISSEARNLISSLGLTPSEIVPLSASDIDRILAWLDSNSLHFGYSAFLPLKEYIEAVIARSAEGGTKQSPDFTTLAVQTLLVDILTGTINPKTTGDMELSLFALQRVAKLHGASATPSRVSFEDLRALVIPAQAGIASPVIAHINGNHYILVTVIAADGTVTYREPNAGPTGQTLTMTQAEFLQVWQGAILSSRAPPHAYQVLTDPEAQRITGSFFFMFFIFLAKLAVGVVSAISTAISFITGALATLVNTIGAAFTALGNAMGPLGFIFNGLGTMVSGLGHALGGLTYLLGGQFALGFETLFQGIGMMAGLSGGLSLQGLGQFALQTAVNLGVSTGLQALGVDPGIAGIAGSFASGGVQSFSGGSFHLGFDYSSALTSTAVAGTQLGLVKAGLDPALAGIASIGVGSIVGSLTVGTQVPKLDDAGNVVYDSAGKVVMKPIPPGLDALGTTLKTQLAPTLAGELAFYGIQKLGESIGLDPRISQLAGMPIKSAVTVGTAGGKATDITKSISDGLLHGATSLGIDLLGDEIGLDPFTQALSANVISGAISGAFKYEGNVFKGVSESLKKSVLNFSTPGTGYDPNAPYNPVQQATYLAKINDFSNIIRERGITTALETYASSIFQRDAIESIWKLGGIADFLLGNAKAVTLEDGRLTTEVTFKENSKLYLDATTDAVLARSYFDPTRGLVKEISSPNPNDKSFGLDEQGRFGLVNGKVLVNTPSGITEEYTVYGGNIVLIEGRDTATGKTRYFVSPREGSDTVRVSPDGRFIEGQVVDLSEDYKFGLLDGDITREIALRPTIIYSSGQIVDAKIQAQGFSDLSPEKLHALAQAMEAAVPPLHDPTPEQRTAAQQAAPQFLAVVKEELTKLVGAENAEAMLKSFGPTLQTLIENPDALPAEQARLQQEQATLTVSKEQASTALSRAMEKGINWLKTQGDSFADDGNWVAGGTLHTIAAAVDLFGDDLRIGVGIQQAKQAAAEGHYGAATMYLLQDGLRAFGLFPAVGLATKGLGKSLQVASKATGIVGDVPTAARSLDRVWGSIKNFFRIGSKVYDVGQGELKLTRTAWEFKAGNSVVKGAVHSADEATEVVYRAVPKGTSNPMRFSTAEGRFNSLDTKVLYTSKDKNVAVSEFLRRNPGAEYDVYEIALKDSRRITLDTLPAEQVSRSLGDTATRASDLGKIVAPSDINGSVNNVVVLREELIKEFNKVAP
ncbi:MAG: hypothetical protein HYS41_06855, partial [Candidatus Omnitrophica bacterium]|nr:hypothetical protein [Candidatus Omnitrophota bacterium]